MGRSLASIALLLIPLAAFAQPLKCIPKEAGVVIKIESPRRLVESAVQLDAWKKIQAFPQIKEILDSANVRRFLQVLAYVETETGCQWPELLDKVAGNGIALGFKPGDDAAPALLVIEGRDEAMAAKVFDIFVMGIKSEAEREGKIKITPGEFHGTPTFTVGDDFQLARHGTRIFIANKRAALEASVSLATNEMQTSIADNATLKKAKALVGPDAAAWLWFDLATAKNTVEGKNYFETAGKDLNQLLLFGSTVNAAKRSDFVAAGLYLKPGGYTFSVRLPAKREANNIMLVHSPASGVGSKPLLEPPGVVFSQSFYLDLGHVWKNRKEMIDLDQFKDLEKGVEEISKYLPGTSVGKILEQSGPYHRIVMAQTGEKLYSKEPGQPIPPAAYIGSIRDPELGKSLGGILRAGALLAGFQTGWKMTEETHDGVKIVTYRFPETGDPKFDDEDNLRFNAAPSFAILKDSFIVGSTPGIVQAVIPLLKQEAAGDREVWKFKVYAAGAADVINAYPDATVTDAVLRQGITLAEARAQTLEFAKWLRSLGVATLSIDHGHDYFSLNGTWTYKK